MIASSQKSFQANFVDMDNLKYILLFTFFVLSIVQKIVPQRQFDNSDRRQDILAFKSEQFAKKTQLYSGIAKQRKQGPWATFHDRLFGEPLLAKTHQNENAINRNLENGQEYYSDRRRGALPVYRNRESSSSMAVLIFMLIVVVSVAIIWMEVDFSTTRNLFRVVSQNESNGQSGRLSSRRSKKAKKRSKSRKSKSNSKDDSDSDSDLELGQKKFKKKKHRSNSKV